MVRQKISDGQFYAAVKKAHLNGGSNKDAIEILAQQGLTISDAVFSQRKTKLLNAFQSSMEEMAGQPNTPELSEKYRKLQEAVGFCQLERANRKSADIFDSLDGLL